jgi:hypothetical protein
MHYNEGTWAREKEGQSTEFTLEMGFEGSSYSNLSRFDQSSWVSIWAFVLDV